VSDGEWLHIDFISNRDHRTLFTEQEIELALSTFMPLAEARVMAREIMEGPIVPGKPAFFADHLLDLLSNLSPDAAKRVAIARNS
jgi:hypothetical protein